MARLRRRKNVDWGEDSKPMDGVSNLSDAMLVFACGLMIAIAVNWNVDLKVQKVDVEPEDVLSETETEAAVGDDDNQNTYKEMGKVYMDPESGEMYMVSDQQTD